ncbi:MAG: tRNA pseudouridine(38-40) synthase TruA [Candidatus Nanopelagicales bacterium]
MNDPAGSTTTGGIVRLRIDLAYDGTEFFGWASQRGMRTVQGTLERALKYSCKLTEEPRVTCAGRTDSGVHARGQVAHVDLPVESWERLKQKNIYPLRSALPSDISVHKVDLAPPGFDARFSALARRYVYRVCDDPALMDPVRRREVYYHYEALDIGAMNEAAQQLLGLHDFGAFCRFRPEGTTIRSLEGLEWTRGDTGLAELTVVADAFCHSMVRSLVGSLIPVGTGAQEPGWPASYLGDPTAPGDHPLARGPFTVAPAHGLSFEEVIYPPDDQLEARILTTKRPRG